MKSILVAVALASQASGYKHSSRFDNLIAEASAQHGIDRTVITSVITLESRFNPSAVGRDGKDLGLMQLRRGGACLGGTARWSNKRIMEPTFNIQRGVACLANAIQRCGGSVAKGLSRYNGRGCRAGTTYAKKVLSLTEKLKVVEKITKYYTVAQMLQPSHAALW